MIEARRPDIVVVDKVKKKTMIIDVAISGYTEVCDKEREKIEKHSLLKNKIIRLWQMKKIVVIPILVGALGLQQQSSRSILRALESRSKYNMFRNQHC